jgi:hypothetical protein
MTGAEWLACADPEPMLEFLANRASERKLQLFAVACCRRAWHLMTDPRQHEAVEAAERFADGLLTEADFQEVLHPIVDLWAHLPESVGREGAWSASHYIIAATRHLGTGDGAPYAANYASGALAGLAGTQGSPDWFAVRQAEDAAQCQLIRDLFGNPPVPFHFDPHWLSGEGSTAVERAREVYREGTFASLSWLGEVLEQAGCRDRDVLEHCKGPGPHARGCWVVDALLGHETAVQTGLLTEADWRACVDPGPLLHFLCDKGSARRWRLFAVACCRRIGHLLADERSRRAVEVAARYADDAASAEELEAARSAAQQAQDEAKSAEFTAEAAANFCTTPAYATVSCRLYAASAARSAVCRDARVTDASPGTHEADRWQPSNAWAAAAISDHAYANFGREPGDAGWEEARRAAESAEAAELRAHCELLRDLFGDYLGPPGKEGGWLPAGLPMGPLSLWRAEGWCLLPTARKLTLRPGWLTWRNGTLRRIAEGIYTDQAFDRLPILADAMLDAGCDDEVLLAHCQSGAPHVRGCWVVDLILGRR